ncbi:aldose 1-epimerase family protein [Nonomuraea sp. NPDC050556]|uniref:aldose 1-epimerase family protein n=1 Tax=Nonomuraea sp. NPDC050556 TaxID=3364369 RepID=UPI0037B8E2C7
MNVCPPLEAGGYTAEVSPRGAALRLLRHGSRDLVTTWEDSGGPIPYYAGAILAPWPNRVGGARYTFGGVPYELEVTEPERGHALHGLVSAAEWRVVEHLAVEDDHAFVRLAHTVAPAPGYPFTLELQVKHHLDASGLTTTVTARNTGQEAAPYGVGPHPWLLPDADELEIPASQVLLADAAMLPAELVDVAGTPYDFRKPRAVGRTAIDHAFTGLSAGEASAGGVRVSWDPAVLPWVQVCVGEQVGYHGLAIEPMTCPPDAFNSGTDLVVLQPGDEHAASWTISVV